MALQGTIQDFALPDIFQLIGIQRKTGILKLTHKDNSVTIKFLEGRVVDLKMGQNCILTPSSSTSGICFAQCLSSAHRIGWRS